MCKMNQIMVWVLVFCGLAAVGLIPSVQANQAVTGDAPAMMASPQTIVLGKVDQVTVHTNIPASSVDYSSVALEGVSATGVWADNCGHLTARFSVDSLSLSPGPVTLTLTGVYAEDGSEFAAADDVTVK